MDWLIKPQFSEILSHHTASMLRTRNAAVFYWRHMTVPMSGLKQQKLRYAMKCAAFVFCIHSFIFFYSRIHAVFLCNHALFRIFIYVFIWRCFVFMRWCLRSSFMFSLLRFCWPALLLLSSMIVTNSGSLHNNDNIQYHRRRFQPVNQCVTRLVCLSSCLRTNNSVR